MLITLPRAVQVYPPGYGGDPNQMLDFGLTGLRGLGDCVDDGDCGATDVVDPSQIAQIIASSPVTLAPPVTYTQPGSSSTAADIAAAANAAANAAKALATTQGPYVVPGTNTIYNPATGQITSLAAINTTAATPLATTLSSMLPIAAIALGAVLVFGMMRR